MARSRTINLSRLLEAIIAARAALPKRLSRSGRAFRPLHVMAEVTYRCNLRCSFCHFLDIIEHKADPLGPVQEQTANDVDRFVGTIRRGRLISFSGGEVLVWRDFREVLARASRTHRTHVITNGTLLRDDVAAELVDLAPRRFWQNGLVLLCISLQGEEATNDAVVGRSGSWQRTIEGARAIVRHRTAAGKAYPKVNLKMVVTQHTVDEIVDFVSTAHAVGADVVNLMVEHSDDAFTGTIVGRSDWDIIRQPTPKPEGVDLDLLRRQLIRAHKLADEYGLELRTTPPNIPIEEFVRHYSDDRSIDPDTYRCTSPWSRAQLTADGRYLVCPYHRVGDATSETLDDVWNGEEIRAFRRELRDAGIFPGCAGCCNLQYTGPQPVGLDGVDDAVVREALAEPSPGRSPTSSDTLGGVPTAAQPGIEAVPVVISSGPR